MTLAATLPPFWIHNKLLKFLHRSNDKWRCPHYTYYFKVSLKRIIRTNYWKLWLIGYVAIFNTHFTRGSISFRLGASRSSVVKTVNCVCCISGGKVQVTTEQTCLAADHGQEVFWVNTLYVCIDNRIWVCMNW